MSSNTGATPPDFSSADVDLKKGFAVIGIVVAFLLALLVLRFGCVLFIDVAILGESADSLIRPLSEIRRCIFPWWHPRTQPQDLSSPQENSRNNETELVNMDRLLMGLTPQQKQELLSSILASKIVSKEDIDVWKSRNDTTTTTTTATIPDGVSSSTRTEHCNLCPICINDIEIGNHVISLIACEHIFHSECLSQWLSTGTHTRDCPCCRTEILTQEMLEEAYRLRNPTTTTTTTTSPPS